MAEGPGTFAEDMDTGLTVMNMYRQQVTDFEVRRADLAAAEKLFDLPISVCTVYMHAVELFMLKLLQGARKK